ncbi:UpxY family transcription antiterminator [Neolewinella lacunae]|uniref:UpxY family transcription antiterminator n=1 Tax=Neolewinella lacunae TaxID=1517758 RepID=A0A923T771_9BACT|nr:UpxY family transcription antiterminator [Neolewinella lacunae]MBC6994180.1 UpxY family transcription antiterminator [Neolewinella lacunae]MDN3636671.1 UpxY family transcription antiterminator [Neolewinella lacunae]
MAIRISCLNHRIQHTTAALADDMHTAEKRWFAVRTSSKHEKRAARELETLGVECYLPLREKVYTYASKKVLRELPLLPGYVFVHICGQEEERVRRAHFVSRFVTLGGERRRVKDAELTLLRRLSTDRNLDWETVEEVFDFTAGTPVEIITGPLAGVRGYYLRKKNKKTFLITLGSLHACLATCEVDPRCLVALDGRAIEAGHEGSSEGINTY